MSFNLNQWFADNVSEDTFLLQRSVGSKKVTDILDKIEAIMDEKNFPLKERKKS